MPADGLFEQPAEQPTALSRALATEANRLILGEKATWTALNFKGHRPCEECAHFQHETGGAFLPRRQARHRRKHPYGAKIDLCHAHALLWKERDEQDTTKKGGAP